MRTFAKTRRKQKLSSIVGKQQHASLHFAAHNPKLEAQLPLHNQARSSSSTKRDSSSSFAASPLPEVAQLCVLSCLDAATDISTACFQEGKRQGKNNCFKNWAWTPKKLQILYVAELDSRLDHHREDGQVRLAGLLVHNGTRPWTTG